MMEVCPALEWLALEGNLFYGGFRELEVEQLGPALQTLQTLQLEQYVLVEDDEDVLERCIRLCPQLQRFQYVATPMTWQRADRPMTVADLLDALAPAQLTLRFLELDLSYIIRPYREDEFEHISLLQYLSRFEELETLYLDQDSICFPSAHESSEEDGNEDVAYEAICIVDMLPRTVKSLGIRVPDGNMRMHDDIETLGLKRQDGMFPELTRFELVIKSGDRGNGRAGLQNEVDYVSRVVLKAFEGTSVEATVRVQEVYGPMSFSHSGRRLEARERSEDIPDGWIGGDEWRAF
ncbi:hypothetical protein HRG_004810 [Hirsutella rhossiliensis]|uniref:Uncharacterized protein n=1 Tax=Hirsutella rhossiliensis TaxID=111463 RepID=A0A9P8MZZ3_9HYPO|nr:uncharacterized protein HRG_04810 [Hirsutella rhossiliensis]KAH0964382.1 hypothetical protein HRG_04810 [Hirsutella rhossiliensis]